MANHEEVEINYLRVSAEEKGYLEHKMYPLILSI